VREETSLEVEITGLAGATEFEMPAVNVVVLSFEAGLVRGEVKVSVEHDAFAWVPLSELSLRPLADQTRDFMLDYAKRKAAGQ